MVSASSEDDSVWWHESYCETPTVECASVSFTEHVVATNAVLVSAIYALDVDGDGDIDGLSLLPAVSILGERRGAIHL